MADEIVRLMGAAERPAILLGEELRYGLADSAEQLSGRFRSALGNDAAGEVGTVGGDLSGSWVSMTAT